MMKYYCNPLPVEYKYQFHRDCQKENRFQVFREAADPTLIAFHGEYYLFASMTLGVYVSSDLIQWTYHPLPQELPLYDYAPDARVVGEYVYLCASKNAQPCHFYRTKDILNGPYQELGGGFPFWDPDLFADEDGRLYFYWGSSNETPIWGVELDPTTLEPIGKKIPLLWSNDKTHGFERFGENHVLPFPGAKPYLEGAWMTKYNGRYYLQYGIPGTEFNIYGDGVYVSDAPLGPFVPASNNPYSYRPGGFMRGAGHGSTLMDAVGGWWHTSTMQISVNNPYERRIGLWKAGFDADGELYCDQRYGDWPIAVEDGGKQRTFDLPPWYLLSYGKKVRTSSAQPDKAANLIVDENCQTWWKADRPGPQWLEIDLGRQMEVHAVQINFADDTTVPLPPEGILPPTAERYIDSSCHAAHWLLEASADGRKYVVIQKSPADGSLGSHPFWASQDAWSVRYIRLQILAMPYDQPACVSGLRVFGCGLGQLPEAPEFTAMRTGPLDMQVEMQAANAIGYNILWGHRPDKLYHSYLTYEKAQKVGALVAGQDYYVRVDAFNESGITEGAVKRLDISR